MRRIALSLLLLISALAVSADIYVVSSEKALVYEGDTETAEAIGSLRRGMEINVSKIESGFCEIDFMGVKGFVSINDLKFKSRSAESASQDEDRNIGEKTKDFVSGTSKKLADGVSGLTGRFFGKKKNKHESGATEPVKVETPVESPVETTSADAVVATGIDNITKGEARKSMTADDYRASVAAAAARASEVSEEGAAGVIYIFDNHKYINTQLVRFNGNLLPLPELEILKDGKGKNLTTYKRAVTKFVVKNPERIILSRDFTWYEKPYHDELTLDVADGDVYYVELISGMKSKLNLLTTQKGAKELENVKKDTKNWTVNPDQYYDN